MLNGGAPERRKKSPPSAGDFALASALQFCRLARLLRLAGSGIFLPPPHRPRALAGEPLLGAWQLVQGPGHLPPPFSRDVARQEWAWDKSLAREEEREEEEAYKARGALLPTAAERHFRQPVCRCCSSHEHRGPGKPIQARAKGRTHAERFCNTHKHRQARTRLSVRARCGRPSASLCRTAGCFF